MVKKRGGLGKKGKGLGKRCILVGKKLNSLGKKNCIMRTWLACARACIPRRSGAGLILLVLRSAQKGVFVRRVGLRGVTERRVGLWGVTERGRFEHPRDDDIRHKQWQATLTVPFYHFSLIVDLCPKIAEDGAVDVAIQLGDADPTLHLCGIPNRIGCGGRVAAAPCERILGQCVQYVNIEPVGAQYLKQRGGHLLFGYARPSIYM